MKREREEKGGRVRKRERERGKEEGGKYWRERSK